MKMDVTQAVMFPFTHRAFFIIATLFFTILERFRPCVAIRSSLKEISFKRDNFAYVLEIHFTEDSM